MREYYVDRRSGFASLERPRRTWRPRRIIVPVALLAGLGWVLSGPEAPAPQGATPVVQAGMLDGAPGGGAGSCTVTNVVDGDTVDVECSWAGTECVCSPSIPQSEVSLASTRPPRRSGR